MAVKLKNSIAVGLDPIKRDNVGSITFLGTGSLLDRKEGTMSYLLHLFGGSTILVDCGPSVLDRLQEGRPKKVDAILLTSSEESSIGSLAACLLSFHEQEKRPMPIVCMSHIGKNVVAYLTEANGLSKDLFELHEIDGEAVQLEASPSFRYSFKKVNETKSIALIEAATKSASVFILHSGFMNEPVFEHTKGFDGVWSKMIAHPLDVIVFHSASFLEKQGSCQFQKLSDWSEEYRNFFLYGHPTAEGHNIVFSQRYMNSLSTKKDNVYLIQKQ